jgi:peptide/nickel transport system ATP-binding protein
VNAIVRKTASPLAAGAALVELRGVSKRFVRSLDTAAKIGNLFGAGMKEEVVRAVDRVDLAVLPGEVVGLVGESGCGKSTLGRVAVGLLPLSRGERYWRGMPLSHLAGDQARRQQLKMQMIFQTRSPRSILDGACWTSSAKRRSCAAWSAPASRSTRRTSADASDSTRR